MIKTVYIMVAIYMVIATAIIYGIITKTEKEIQNEK